MVTYWMPKGGTDDSDWEDGAAYSERTGWFAVADGASTGAHSREWAFTLTSSFVTDRPDVFAVTPSGFAAWLDGVRADFDPHSGQFSESRAPQWVQEAGSRRGSHATLLAGRVACGWIDAVAVGDCCLFHLRVDQPLSTFPMTSSQEFGSAPDLVPSRLVSDPRLESTVRHYRAALAARDTVLVASDALAEWMIRNRHDTRTFDLLAGIGHQGFRELCTDLRAARQLKNDDVTLLRVGPCTTQGEQ